MGSVVVGVIGALLGVLVGGAVQQMQASRARNWQREDSLSSTKRAIYAEYLRSISASYAQAMSGHRSRSEDANLHAATAEIEVLCGEEVSRPARDLVNKVIDVHSKIAAGTGVVQAVVGDVDRRRYEVIDLFKADLGLKPRRQPTVDRRGRVPMTVVSNLDDFQALDPFFRIIERGVAGLVDGEHFFDLLAEDVIVDYVITVPGYPRRVEGRHAVAELYRPYGATIVLDRCYDLAVHHDQVTGVVVLEYASQGRVVPTGAAYNNRYVSVLSIIDRKVAHWRDYLDPLAVFDAVGWPAAAAGNG